MNEGYIAARAFASFHRKLKEPMSRTETEDVPVIVKEERDLSYLLVNQKGKEGFFPKSQIHFKQRNIKTREAIACIPLWILEAKGW